MRTTFNDQFRSDSKDRMPIWFLWRGIWRFIFDEISCGINHQRIINDEIMKWNNVVQYQKKIRTESYGPEAVGTLEPGKNGNYIDEIEYNIQRMAHFLVKNEHGGFDRTKDLLRIHNIDYKRFILCKDWFPECQDPKSQEKAQAALKANMEEFPEYYPELHKNRIKDIE
jgi:hypothetical protein